MINVCNALLIVGCVVRGAWYGLRDAGYVMRRLAPISKSMFFSAERGSRCQYQLLPFTLHASKLQIISKLLTLHY